VTENGKDFYPGELVPKILWQKFTKFFP
jgi:hypothetical protein